MPPRDMQKKIIYSDNVTPSTEFRFMIAESWWCKWESYVKDDGNMFSDAPPGYINNLELL